VRVLIAALAVAIAATVEWRLAVTPIAPGVPLADIAVVVCASGLLVTFAGLAVWRLRPHGVTGPLLEVAGCGVLLGGLAGVDPPPFDLAGSLAWAVFPLAVAHVLWGYPNGLRGRSGIAAAVVCWLVPAALGIPLVLVAERRGPARLSLYAWFPSRSTARTGIQPELAAWLARGWSVWVGAVAVLVAATGLVRARASPPDLRLGLVPVAWAGMAWAAATLGSLAFSVQAVGEVTGSREAELARLAGLILPAVAAALVAGAIAWGEVVRPRLDPTREGRITLPGEPLPVAEALRRRLAKAVGDPTVRLAVQGPDGQWLSADGRPVQLRDDGERATTTLTRGGQVIAALECDSALRASPDLVVATTTMAGLAIDNVRLAALDAAQLEEIRNSGAALLTAADRARHGLTSSIAGGAASRLETLANRAAGGADRTELQRALRDVATEVRTLSHGLFPPELERAGLHAALDDAAEVPSRRFPRAIELTAYLVATGHPEARLAYGDGQLVITIAGPPTEHAAVRVAALDGDVVLVGDTATVRIPVPE
jgi:signal transduction histidine kinase